MNVFRRKRKRKDVLVINRKSIQNHKTIHNMKKGKNSLRNTLCIYLPYPSSCS